MTLETQQHRLENPRHCHGTWQFYIWKNIMWSYSCKGTPWLIFSQTCSMLWVNVIFFPFSDPFFPLLCLSWCNWVQHLWEVSNSCPLSTLPTLTPLCLGQIKATPTVYNPHIQVCCDGCISAWKPWMDQVLIKLFFLVLFVLLFCLWASFLVIIERSKVLICVSGEKKNPFPMTVIDLKQRFLSNKKKKIICMY